MSTTAKKTVTKKAATEKVAEPEVSAEDILENELRTEELLADLPELRPPHRLRLRHRNQIILVVARAEESGAIDAISSGSTSLSSFTPVMNMLAEIDEFAESIAEDKEAYAEWAEKNATNYDAFLAIMNRYSRAVGE